MHAVGGTVIGARNPWRHAMDTILAIDLGKFNSVLYDFEATPL